MMRPQAYLRVTSIGIADPMGYVIAVVLIVVSSSAMWRSALRDARQGLRHRAARRRRARAPPHATVGKPCSPMRWCC